MIAKDVTPAKYMARMMPELEGHDVRFFADPIGQAANLWDSQSIAYSTELTEFHPEDYTIILVGCSTNSPMEVAALALNYEVDAIPSLGICDTRGAHTRHYGYEASHYIAPSDWATAEETTAHTTIVGDANIGPLPQPSDEAKQKLLNWAGSNQVFLWMAQSTYEPLETVLRYLQPEQKLLMGLHPDPNKWPDTDRIRAVLNTLGADRAAVVSEIEDSLRTPHALAALDPEHVITFTGFSGIGTEAAMAGYRVVLTDDAAMREDFARNCPPGDGMLPLEELIGAPTINETSGVYDLFSLPFPDPEMVHTALRPFDPAAAVKILLDMAE